jgi:Peptidase family M41
MALRYGMSEALGNVTYDRDRSPFLQPIFPVPQERSYSEGTVEAVDRAVRELVGRAFDQALAILQSNRVLLGHTAAALLKSETLNELKIERMKEEIVTAPALPAAAAIAASPVGGGALIYGPICGPRPANLRRSAQRSSITSASKPTRIRARTMIAAKKAADCTVLQ